MVPYICCLLVIDQKELDCKLCNEVFIFEFGYLF